MSNDIEKVKTILVIDDDSSILGLLQTILEGNDFNALLAADGVYGMQLVKENTPDLVLLDITMPGPDGYHVIQSIREFSSIPIIMITGNHTSEATQRCFELGANDYITKPFRPAEVVARIRTKLKRPNN
ncbi:response regulator transcription factor [Chloroflexota bacterium]